MRTIFKIFGLIALLSFILINCKKDENEDIISNSDLVGTWVLVSVTNLDPSSEYLTPLIFHEGGTFCAGWSGSKWSGPQWENIQCGTSVNDESGVFSYNSTKKMLIMEFSDSEKDDKPLESPINLSGDRKELSFAGLKYQRVD